MNRPVIAMLAGASLMTLSHVAQAQATADASRAVGAAPAQHGTAAANPVDDEKQDSTGVNPDSSSGAADIIITARRSSESLQNVPQTVTAVSGESIQKLNFTQFQDVAAAVPGLTLNFGAVTAGRSPSPSLRGVTFDASAAPSPTVDTYLNEAPVAAGNVFTALYDIGDIQVLKGPQGTLRGRTAPSGAILVGTKRASTTEWGGYTSGLLTNKHAINAQAALNVPIIKGLLGLRVAGVVDQSDNDFVRSAATGLDPYRNVASGRATLLFTPAQNLSASIVYQYLSQQSRRFDQVEGAGAPGGRQPTAPANYNGPAITASQRLGADDLPRDLRGRTHQVTTNVVWDVLGHSLSYVGSYVNDHQVTKGDLDSGNALIGNPLTSALISDSRSWTHEVRLSSAGSGNLIDYSVGYFHSKGDGLTTGSQPASALAGALGSPASPDPRVLNSLYVLSTAINAGGGSQENSFYANATLHIGQRTEITGGARYIINKQDQFTTVVLAPGAFIAARVPVRCSLAGLADSPYAGYCNVAIAPGNTPVLDQALRGTSKPIVYSASLKHRFSEEVLAYATVGSSWRRGGANTGITNAANDPTLNALVYTPNETSTSYEAGIKTNFLDRRLRLNLAGFYQKFNNLIFQTTSVPYVQTNGQTALLVNSNFNVGANAIVKGFDFDGAFQPTENFSIALGVSYADGKVDNAVVPCRDANFDGVADSGSTTLADYQSRGLAIAQCQSRQSVSRDPIWNGTLQSEYHAAVSNAVEGYVRGLLNYFPKNSRNSAGFTVSNYALLNLYAGIRSPNGMWDIGVFARNATNAGIQLSRDPSFITTAAGVDAIFGGTGYRYVSYTPPRQIGLSVRYQFGVR